MNKEIFDMVKELQQIRIDIQSSQEKLEDTIQKSLPLVDRIQQSIHEVFDITLAVALCKAGYFVQHIDFSSKESLHYFDGVLYYEDGSAANVQYFKENEMSDNWHIKKNPLQVDLVKLRDMHIAADGEMLSQGSYEDCFK